MLYTSIFRNEQIRSNSELFKTQKYFLKKKKTQNHIQVLRFHDFSNFTQV